MMKTSFILPLLFFCILLACNSPKSGENTQSADADTASEQERLPPDEAPKTADTTEQQEHSHQTVSDLIQLEHPGPNEEILSPLTVKGKARGMWYFEAEFQVLLKDKDDHILAQSQAVAQGPWMTEDFVSFEATLRFDLPSDAQGTLVLQKANPSGMAEHEQSYSIPVRFPAEN